MTSNKLNIALLLIRAAGTFAVGGGEWAGHNTYPDLSFMRWFWGARFPFCPVCHLGSYPGAWFSSSPQAAKPWAHGRSWGRSMSLVMDLLSCGSRDINQGWRGSAVSPTGKERQPGWERSIQGSMVGAVWSCQMLEAGTGGQASPSTLPACWAPYRGSGLLLGQSSVRCPCMSPGRWALVPHAAGVPCLPMGAGDSGSWCRRALWWPTRKAGGSGDIGSSVGILNCDLCVEISIMH